MIDFGIIMLKEIDNATDIVLLIVILMVINIFKSYNFFLL